MKAHIIHVTSFPRHVPAASTLEQRMQDMVHRRGVPMTAERRRNINSLASAINYNAARDNVRTLGEEIGKYGHSYTPEEINKHLTLIAEQSAEAGLAIPADE